MKKIPHKDWVSLQNEMTTRMAHNSIDMCFLMKFYSYITSGYPVGEHEEKREIILKEQKKTLAWKKYCEKLQNKRKKQ